MSQKYYELEPRILLDAAALLTAGEVVETGADTSAQVEATEHTSSTQEAKSSIELLLSDLGAVGSTGDEAIQSVVFVDNRLTNDYLLPEPDAVTQVFVLDANSSAIEQISEVLTDYGSLSSIHIIGHGNDGELLLGNSTLNQESLLEQQSQIAQWQDSVQEGADLLLYGCELAQSETGKSFAEQFSVLTGMDVAASTDSTGLGEVGGDWELEFSTGDVATQALSLVARDEAMLPDVLAAGASNDSQTTGENASVSGNVLDNDTAAGSKTVTEVNGASNLVGTAVSGSNGGSFTINSDGSYSFDPGTDFDDLADGESRTTKIDSYTLTDSDDSSTDTAKLTITVTGSNDTPIVTASTAALAEESNLNSPASQTITNSHLNVTDSESAASDITYTVTALPSYGSLTLSGSILAANDTFTQADVDSGRLSYINDGSEESSDSFQFSVSDGAGAQLTNQTLTISLAAYNDPLEPDSSMTLDGSNNVDMSVDVSEGGTVTLTTAELLYTDVDTLNENITYTLTSLSDSEGQLLLDTVQLSNGGTFTQADISAGRVTYQHNGDEPSASQGFNFSVTDGSTTLTGSMTINVTPVNDTPVITGSGLTVTEGGSGNFSAAFDDGDPDNSDNQIMYTIETLPSEGVLKLNGISVAVGTLVAGSNLNQLTYTHNGGEVTSDTFRISLNDGAGGIDSQFDVPISISAVNDQVSVSGGNSINEGQANVPVTISVSDNDDLSSAITVTIDTLPDDGVLYFDSNGNGVGEAGEEVTAGDSYSASDISKLLFTHDGNDKNGGNPPDVTFDITVQDSGGNTGDSANATSVSTTITLSVIPVDDDPLLPVNTGPSLVVDSGDSSSYLQVLNNTMLSATDVDSSATNLVYTVESIPAYGRLLLNGADLAIGASFSQADIDSGALSYRYSGGATDSDSFTFTLKDSAYNGDEGREGGLYSGSDPVVSTFNIGLSGDLDSSFDPGTGGDGSGNPVIDRNSSMYVDEGSSNNAFAITHLHAHDDGPDSDILYTLDSAPTEGTLWVDSDGDNVLDAGEEVTAGESFTQDDIENGRLRYDNSGSEASSDSFQFDLSDANGGNVINDQTFNIIVRAVNDAPILDVNTGISSTELDEGGTVTITTSHLQASDVDNDIGTLNPSEMVYSIKSLPTNGTVLLNGTALSLYQSFTQQDLLDGNVTFRHDGSEDFLSSFDFTLSDGSSTVDSTFNIDANPVNDQPSLNNLTVTLKEGDAVTISVLSGSDVDGVNDDKGLPENTLTYTITALPTHGTLTLNGSTVNGTTLISHADISKLVYTHDSSENYSDSFQVTVNDNTGESNATSTGTVTLQISPVNDDPVTVTNTGAELHEGQSILIGSSGSAYVTDVSGVLSAQDSDNSAVQNQFRITDSVEHGTLELDISGSGNWKVLGVGSVFTQDDLDSNLIRYTADPDYEADPSVTQDDSFTVRLSDAGGGTEPEATFNINILPVDDAPEITLPANQSTNQGTSVTFTGLSFEDVDVGSNDVEVTLNTNNNGVISLTSVSGLTFTTGDGTADSVMTFSGTLASVNAAVASLTYAPTDPDYSGTVTVNVTIDDLGNVGDDPDTLSSIGLSGDGDNNSESATGSFTVEVQAVNEAPTITIGSSTAALDEDSSVTFSSANSNAITFGDLDQPEAGWDANNELTVTLGVNNGDLTLATTNGLSSVSGDGTSSVTLTGTIAELDAALEGLVYTPETNFDESDTLSISVNDNINFGTGNALSASASIAITVNPVDDDPTINSPTDVTLTEDHTGYAFSLAFETVDSGTGTDPVPDSFQIGSLPTSGTLYLVDPSTGEKSVEITAVEIDQTYTSSDTQFVNGQPRLIYVPAAEQNDVSLGSAVTFTYRISDDGGSNFTADATGTLNITAVNDAPVLSVTDAGNTFVEQDTGSGTAVQIVSASTVTDIEIDGNGSENVDYANATLTVIRQGGAVNTDIFTIDGSATVSGSNVVVGSTTVGTVSGDGSSSLVVTFSAYADASDVNSVIQSVMYASSSDDPGTSATVAFTFDDGNDNNEQGTGGSLSDTKTVTVEITESNDAPTASDVNLTLLEDPASNNGTQISSLSLFSDTDNNNTLAGIAITANSETVSGSWEYSTDGSSWNSMATNLSDSNALVLSADSYVRFVPATDSNDAYDATTGLTVRVLDNSYSGSMNAVGQNVSTNGGQTAISSNTATIGMSVTAVNDEPSAVVSNSTINVNEDDGAQTLSNFMSSILAGGQTDEDGQEISFAVTNIVKTTSETSLTVNELFDQLPSFSDAIATEGDPANTLIYTTSQHLADGESETVEVTVSVTDDGGTANGGDDRGSDRTFTIKITGENDAPVAVGDTATAVEAGGLNNGTAGTNPSGNVLSNDSDTDSSDTLAVSAITGGTVGGSTTGSYGTLTLNSNGSYDYVVDNSNATVEALTGSSDTLTETFTYTVSDGNGGIDTETLTITIQGANDTPVAANDTGSGNESDIITVDVLANDSDVDSDDNPASFTLVSADSIVAANGSSVDTSMLSIVGNQLKMVPGSAFEHLAVGETETLTIGYTMRDNDGATSTATVTLTINGVNDAPVAAGDTAIAVEAGGLNNGTAGTNPSGNVLSNDSDTDSSDTLTVSAITGGTVGGSTIGSYGTLTLNSDGSYDYVVDNSNSTVEGLKDSSDTLTETFTYTVSDGKGGTDTETLTITIQGANDTPVAANDTGSGNESDTITVDVLANDSDVDSDDNAASFTLVSADSIVAANGSSVDSSMLSIVNNQLQMVPGSAFEHLAAGETETLTIGYTMRDNDGATSTATVTLTINGVNDAPVAAGDTAIAVEAGGLNNGTSGTNPSGNVLSNDSDTDSSDTLAVSAITGGTVGGLTIGSYGTLTLNSDGSYDYVVDNSNATVEGLTGSSDTLTETFTYTVSDGNGGTDTETLTITIQGANDTPVAANDTGSGNESDTITVDVLANDSDVDSDDNPANFTLVSADSIVAANGSSVDSSMLSIVNNQLQMVPGSAFEHLAVGETETLTIGYTMRDNDGATSTATVILTINGVNDAPVASADTATAVEAGGLNNGTAGTNPSGNVLSNDSDTDSSDTLTVSAITGGTVGGSTIGSYGTLTLNSNGSYDYVVDNSNATVEALTGSSDTLTETFTYTVSDGNGGIDTETLTITIQGANDTPVAANDAGSGNESDTITVDVLANDSDVDSDDNSASFTLVSADSIVAANGSSVDTSMLSIVNNQLQMAPGSAFEHLAVGETETLTIGYTMRDNDGATSTATVTLTINGVNDAPVAAGDTATAVEAGGLNNGTAGTNPSGNVLSNDSDTDSSDTLTVSAITGGTVGGSTTGSYGTLTLNSNGSYDYVVDNSNATVEALTGSSDTLTETFTYTVSDGNGGIDTETLTITIQGANDTPVAANDTGSGNESDIITVDVLANDSDVDSDDNPASFTLVSADSIVAANGSSVDTSMLSIVGNQLKMVPGSAFEHLAVGETETLTIGYTMRDNDGATSTATVTLTINGVNDAPVAAGDTAIAVEAGGLNNGTAGTNPSGNVLSNDSDTDSSDTLTVSAITGGTVGGSTIGSYGTLTLNSDGSYDYVVDNSNSTVEGLKDSSDTLTETFTYTVSDGKGGTDTETLTITIQGANDTPVAANDTGSGNESDTITVDVLANDSDVDSDDNAASFTLVSADSIVAANGSSVDSSMLSIVNNQLQMVPGSAFEHLAAGETETLTIGYTMRDNDGATSTATVTLTINGVNDAPVAAGDTAIAVEAGGLNNGTSGTNPSGNVLSNDSDTDSSDTLAVSAITGGTVGGLTIGSYGTLTLNSDGSYDYVVDNSNATVQGLKDSSDTLTETFTYTVSDGNGGTDTETLTITIQGANDTPVAANDTGSGNESDTITVDVLANDSDVDSDDNPASFTLVSADSIVAANGSSVDTSMLSIVNNQLQMVPGSAFEHLAAGETETLTIGYTMRDNDGATSTATVTLTINGVNDAPVAAGDTAIPVEAGGLNNGTSGTNPSGNVLSNDSDTDSSDTLAVSAINGGTVGGSTIGSYGTLTLNSDGSYSYAVDNSNATVEALTGSSDTLTETFTYTVSDGNGGIDTETLTITIQGANDTPVAANDTGSGNESDTITVDVLANDSDVDSDDNPASFTLVSADSIVAANGSSVDTSMLSIVNNQLQMAPGSAFEHLAVGETETLTIGYTMRDNDGATSTATVILTINGVNDAPVAAGDTAIAVEAGGLNNGTSGTNPSGNVLSNDSDTDSSDTLAVSAITGGTVGGLTIGSYGTLTLNSDGSYDYVVDNSNATVEGLKDSSDTLTETFTYTVSDGNGGTDTETLTITIQGANDTPVAANDIGSGNESDTITVDVLANDSDVDSDDNPASFTLVSADSIVAANGSSVDTSMLSIVNNQLQMVPGSAFEHLAVGETETLTIGYTMRDNDGATSTATVTLTINGVNDAPVAAGDTATAVEAGGLNNGTAGTNPSGNVLSNDSDTDSSDTLTVSAITGGTVGGSTIGSYGTLTLNSNGSYDYVVDNSNATVEGLKDSSDTLTETFTYTVSDGKGGTDTETLTITIQGANDDPVASSDTVTAVEAGGLNNAMAGTDPTGNVLSNDSDIENNALTVVAVNSGVVGGTTTGSYGTLTLNSDGSYDYVVDNSNSTVEGLKDSSDTLTETFTYTVSDGNGGTDTETLTITIQGANDTPVAANDIGSGNESDTITVDVLANDSDVDSDDNPASFTLVSADSIVAANGSSVDTGMLSIVNNQLQMVPGSAFEHLAVGETETLTIGYTMRDNDGATSTATVTLTINGVNDAPLAAGDTATAVEAGGLNNGTAGTNPSGNVLSNDSDTDSSDTLTVSAITGGTVGGSTIGSYGTLTLNSNGSYDYVVDNSNATVEGLKDSSDTLTETFTYTVSDGKGGTDTETLTITIQGANDDPVASSDTVTAVEAGGLNNAMAGTDPTGNVLSNDSDIENNDLTVVAVNSGVVGGTTTGSYGTLTLNSDGSYDYVVDNSNATVEGLKDSSDTLTETFTYTVSDGNGGTDTETLTITIQGANDDPVASSDTATAVEAGGLNNATAGTDPTGNVLSNDSDIENNDLTVVAVNSGVVGGTTTGSYGTLTLNSDGSYDYVVDNSNATVEGLKDSSDTLTETFTYTVSDGNGGTDTETLTITIQGANDTPVAANDTGSGNESDTITVDVLANDSDVDSDDNAASFTLVSADSIVAANGSSVDTGMLSIVNNQLQMVPGSAFEHLAAGETETLTIAYTMRDNDGATSSTTVTLTINGVNDAPEVGTADSFTGTDLEVVSGIDISTYFSDVDNGDQLSFSAVNLPSGLSIDTSSGVISGTLDASASQQGTSSGGVYTVTVTAQDSQGETSDLEFTYTISNPSPVATDNSNSVTEDAESTTVNGNVLSDDNGSGTDSDPDGDSLVVSNTGSVAGAYGTLTLSGDGSYTYELDNSNVTVQALAEGESVTDSFSYTVSDGEGGTSTAQLTIVVNGQDEPLIVEDQGESDTAEEPAAEESSTEAVSAPSDNSDAPAEDGSDSLNSALTRTQEVLGSVYETINTTNDDSVNTTPVSLRIVLQDQILGTEGVNTFSLPSNAFQHTDPNETIAIEVTLLDGSPLPDFVEFDPESGAFEIDAEVALERGNDEIVIRVTGRDNEGNAATATFTIILQDTQPSQPQEAESGEQTIQLEGSNLSEPETDEQQETDSEQVEETEAAGTESAGIDQQLKYLGEGEFAMRKAQLLTDIKQLFG